VLQDEPERDEERDKRKRGASEHRGAVDVAVQLPEARGRSIGCRRFIPHLIQGPKALSAAAASLGCSLQHGTGEGGLE